MRIVVRCQDPRAGRAAQDALARAGLEAVVAPGTVKPSWSLPEGEDVVIVPEPDRAVASAIARAAAASERPSLAILAGLAEASPPDAGLENDPDFSGAIALDAPAPLLAAQVAAAVRAGAAEEEALRRAATAAALKAPKPAPFEARKLKALYIGAPSPLFLSLEAALGRHRGLVAAAFSSFAGFDHLHDEPFDAVVLNGAQDAATALSLCAALRRNASLYHLPTMVVTAPDDHATRATAIDRGASATVAVNAPSGASLGWLFEAIRRERKRTAAEHDMRALRDVMGDPRTGLFKRDAFDAHLARLAQDHHTSGRPLSVAVLRVMPAHGAREPEASVWAKGFTEIANLAARLMRDSDSGASIGAEFIVLAMPATDMAGAKRTAERVAAVAECTNFASGENGTGPVVFEQSTVELQPGESGNALLARGMRAHDLESIPA